MQPFVIEYIRSPWGRGCYSRIYIRSEQRRIIGFYPIATGSQTHCDIMTATQASPMLGHCDQLVAKGSGSPRLGVLAELEIG